MRAQFLLCLNKQFNTNQSNGVRVLRALEPLMVKVLRPISMNCISDDPVWITLAYMCSQIRAFSVNHEQHTVFVIGFHNGF